MYLMAFILGGFKCCTSFFQDPHNALQGWNLTPVLSGQPGQFPWILSRPGQH